MQAQAVNQKQSAANVQNEGHRRETRKSYQKYLEEMKDGEEQLNPYIVVKMENEEESTDPEVPQIVRKSRRTPVPKRSFDLIDNYSESGEGKKKEGKQDQELSTGKSSSQGPTSSKISKTLTKPKTQIKASTVTSKVPKVVYVPIDDANSEANPSRRSGRTPKPKKSFNLIDNELESVSSSKKQGEKPYDVHSAEMDFGTPDYPLPLSPGSLRDRNSKRSRKSQPTKSVSQTDIFQEDEGERPEFNEVDSLQIKQEVDCSASPEYPVQSWRGEGSSSFSAISIKQEVIDDDIPMPEPVLPVVAEVNSNLSEWGTTQGDDGLISGLPIKRDDEYSSCMCCKDQGFGISSGQCKHDRMLYNWSEQSNTYSETPFGNIIETEQQQISDAILTKDESMQKKKAPSIMASLKKKKKTTVGEGTGSTKQGSKGKEDKRQLLSSVEEKQKQKKSELSEKETKKKVLNKKPEKLTLNLKDVGNKVQCRESGLSSSNKKDSKKLNKKSKKSHGEKSGTSGSSKSEKGDRVKSQSREEHASFSTVTERSDGHIILKLSSPTGDPANKEGKKEKLKSSKHINKGSKDKEIGSRDKKKKKVDKNKKEAATGKPNDHIVLKLPINAASKEKQEIKKAVKRKLETDENKSISEQEIRVKKKKVFKKKNGQRMLVKIVTEHVNKEGRVVKQEEERVLKEGGNVSSKEQKADARIKEMKEKRTCDTKTEVKKTPQREKRDPGKTKSNKEKKTQTLTAYILFCRRHRPRLVEENPDMDFSQISKKMAEKWKSTPEEEKEIYRQQLQEHKAKINAQKKTKLKYTGEKVTWEPSGKKEFPVVKYGTAYLQPVDMAAHLHLLGDALLMIATALRRQDQTTVHGALSVLLDSALCSIAPLVFLTSNVPELDVIPAETKASVLDDIAYILPGM